MATGNRGRMNRDRFDRQRTGEDRANKEDAVKRAGSLGEAGSPGRTPGNAEGDRSDIEEWLKEDSDQEERERTSDGK